MIIMGLLFLESSQPTPLLGLHISLLFSQVPQGAAVLLQDLSFLGLNVKRHNLACKRWFGVRVSFSLPLSALPYLNPE